MALKTNAQFNDVDDELAHGTYDLFHRFFSSEDACDSWYEVSCFNRFEECDGDDLLSWKDKGYITVVDLLQVNRFVQMMVKSFFKQINLVSLCGVAIE